MTKVGLVKETRTSVRLPAGWHDRIRLLATASRRSIHAEIIWLIGRGMQAEENQGETRDAANR
jgi:hypothetical protein